MTSKADLVKENEKTREVKAQDEAIKEKAKDVVHDVKKGAEDLAAKTKDMDIKDAPDVLLPSAKSVDQGFQHAKDSLEITRANKNVTLQPRIQQVLDDAEKIIDDGRKAVRIATEDGTLSETAHHAADLAQLIKDQSPFTLDKLWTNWAGLLAVIAGSTTGSWKQILQESGHLFQQLNQTREFMTILTDLQSLLGVLSSRADKHIPIGKKLQGLNQEWEEERDKLLTDCKKVWGLLRESPLWQQLVVKGKAIKEQAKRAAQETKGEVEKSVEKVEESEETKKLKADFKNVLQIIVGKDGPDVQPFLDYSSEAYTDIVENDDFSAWASDLSDLFEHTGGDQETYEKQMQDVYSHTQDWLDNVMKNRHLKLALRESRKLIKAAKKDPMTKKLIADSRKLLAHVTDKKGVHMLNPQLLGEIRALVVPMLIDHLDNTPLPDYHGHASNALGKFDYTLSDMRMGTTGIVPSTVKIEFRYKAEANPSELKVEKQKMLMYLEASDIQLSFKDVKWAYNRHTIPRFSDHGTIDLATAGKGITLRLKAQLHDYQPPTHAQSLTQLLSEPKEHKMFTVLLTECEIDDFHVRVSDAGGASVFYEMLAGIWGTQIKHQIESLIEGKMTLLATKFDTQIYDIVRRATEPTLAEETKDALLGAGKAAGEKVQDVVEETKGVIKSL